MKKDVLRKQKLELFFILLFSSESFSGNPEQEEEEEEEEEDEDVDLIQEERMLGKKIYDLFLYLTHRKHKPANFMY